MLNGHTIDAGSTRSADEASAHQAANDDQGPASAEPRWRQLATVQMASAEELQAAGLSRATPSNGAVEKIIADALDDGNGRAVDALLNAVHGGNGEVPALANLASPPGSAVSAWDMASNGGSAGNA